MQGNSFKMSEYSGWQILLDFITKTSIKEEKIEEFVSGCKNDNSKRIQSILSDDETSLALIKWMDGQLSRHESLETAQKLRKQGNLMFSDKDYFSCVKIYTESIVNCPREITEELSLAYANRSAALFQLELYEDCLKDIQTTLDLNYPSNLIPKILLRKLKCFEQLGLTDEKDSILNLLENLMDNLQLSETRKIKSELKLLKSNRQFSNKETENQPLVEVPELFCGENTNFTHASIALDVKYSADKGRYVIANRDIRAGETLFVEPPRGCVVLPDFHNTRCHHCTKNAVNYPCLGCGLTWFCSNKCRTDSFESYHGIECGLLPVLYSIGIAHLGLRIVVTIGLNQLLAFANDPQLTQKIPGVDSPYITKDYSTSYHLLSHTEKMAPEEIYQYSVTAALLTLLLERHTSFFEGKKKEVTYIVGGLILKHICQMVSNAHAITELCSFDSNNPATVHQRQERVATAIYPAASMMNHSCDPTVINSFQGNLLVVRAIKDVSKDDEVFNCYGPHYRRMRRSERLESLEAQYCFTCQCESCLDTETEDFQDLIYSFQCRSCQGALVSPKQKPASSRDQKALCRSCKTQQDYFPQLQADMEAMSLEALGTEAMNNGDITQAIKLLTKCVQLRCTSLYKSHPDLGQSADELAQCFVFIGKYKDCERVLRISLTAVEEQYGRYSIEMANEIQKFTDVLFELAKEKEDLAITRDLKRYLKDATLIYQIHYGVWSSSYQEIVEKKNRVDLLENEIHSKLK